MVVLRNLDIPPSNDRMQLLGDRGAGREAREVSQEGDVYER